LPFIFQKIKAPKFFNSGIHSAKYSENRVGVGIGKLKIRQNIKFAINISNKKTAKIYAVFLLMFRIIPIANNFPKN
jgi:hypothetical protein